MALNLLCRLNSRSASMAANRVLVHIKRTADQSPCKLRFTQSAVNLLNESNTEDIATAYTKVEDGKFMISNKKFPGFDGPKDMKRPTFCPIKTISKDIEEKLPKDIQERGIDTGAVMLVESSDGKILLIRRALHLRTFPGVWVPPGGHLEAGEQVWEAGFRELHEETGIHLTRDMCENEDSPVLTMWESTFPPVLAMGPPQRHHIVTYLHVKLKAPHTSESVLLNPDPQEVGAAAWLDRSLIQDIINVQGTDQIQSSAKQTSLPQKIQVLMVERGIPNYTMDYEVDRLLHKVDEEQPDRERVSTGTIWALSQWLKSTSS